LASNILEGEGRRSQVKDRRKIRECMRELMQGGGAGDEKELLMWRRGGRNESERSRRGLGVGMHS